MSSLLALWLGWYASILFAVFDNRPDDISQFIRVEWFPQVALAACGGRLGAKIEGIVTRNDNNRHAGYFLMSANIPECCHAVCARHIKVEED